MLDRVLFFEVWEDLGEAKVGEEFQCMPGDEDKKSRVLINGLISSSEPLLHTANLLLIFYH